MSVLIGQKMDVQKNRVIANALAPIVAFGPRLQIRSLAARHGAFYALSQRSTGRS